MAIGKTWLKVPDKLVIRGYPFAVFLLTRCARFAILAFGRESLAIDDEPAAGNDAFCYRTEYIEPSDEFLHADGRNHRTPGRA